MKTLFLLLAFMPMLASAAPTATATPKAIFTVTATPTPGVKTKPTPVSRVTPRYLPTAEPILKRKHDKDSKK